VLVAVCLLAPFQGCSTDYVIKSSRYPEYEGEINQHRRLIRTDRPRIFQILTDESRFSEVCPKGTIVTHESPLPYQVGTIVKTRIDHIYKLEWSSRVEDITPDTRICLQFLDGFFSGGAEIWELEPAGDRTRVSHTIIVQPRGFLRKLAWHMKVRLKHDKMLEALLDNLQRICEAP
jgi:hypothetical protein